MLFRIVAIEKFLVRTTYDVEAASEEEAIAECRDGRAAYDRHEILDGEAEWIETESVESL